MVYLATTIHKPAPTGKILLIKFSSFLIKDKNELTSAACEMTLSIMSTPPFGFISRFKSGQ